MSRDERTDFENESAYVLGYVDGYGAVHARIVTNWDCIYGSSLHTPEERMAGRPFRWDVSEGGFGHVEYGCAALEPDDILAVLDWLDSAGFR